LLKNGAAFARSGAAANPGEGVSVSKRSASGRKGRVLVLEHDPELRDILSLSLQREGYVVDTASDGPAALADVAEAPDLILLDYVMPRLHAPGFLAARRAHPRLADAPVVIISCSPDLSEYVISETVGLIHKPVDLELLLECVHYHCGSGRTLPRFQGAGAGAEAAAPDAGAVRGA
jgi:DNA-binding response OmpR family regulator